MRAKRLTDANEATVSRAVLALTALRSILEQAYPTQPSGSNIPRSTGQCAVSALIVQVQFGGELTSARVCDESHWFNRIVQGDTVFDVDVTGDQFGLPAIQCRPRDALYTPSQRRKLLDVTPETFARAIALARCCGLAGATSALLTAARSVALERFLQAKDHEDTGEKAEGDDARHEPRRPPFF